MIPIGKQMAEALLMESDDSTASISETSIDRDSFHDNAHLSNSTPSISNATVHSMILDYGQKKVSETTFGRYSMERNISPTFAAANPEDNTLYKPFSETQCVALNCHKVGVGPGGKRSVLARVSIVDQGGRRVFDTYVRVEERVTDYRSHFTGISEYHLSSKNAMPFGKCRQQVIRLLRNNILVGHNLKSDLSALGISHPWHDIRDTSTYYAYQKLDRYGCIGPQRLRDLAKIYLGQNSQPIHRPHCPLEDARVAMALYLRCRMEWDYVVSCHRRGPTVPSPRGGFQKSMTYANAHPI